MTQKELFFWLKRKICLSQVNLYLTQINFYLPQNDNIYLTQIGFFLNVKRKNSTKLCDNAGPRVLYLFKNLFLLQLLQMLFVNTLQVVNFFFFFQLKFHLMHLFMHFFTQRNAYYVLLCKSFLVQCVQNFFTTNNFWTKLLVIWWIYLAKC